MTPEFQNELRTISHGPDISHGTGQKSVERDSHVLEADAKWAFRGEGIPLVAPNPEVWSNPGFEK